MSLGRMLPNTRETPDETKGRVWRQHGYAVVELDDPRLPWDLREMLKRFMTRQYGERYGQGIRRR